MDCSTSGGICQLCRHFLAWPGPLWRNVSSHCAKNCPINSSVTSSTIPGNISTQHPSSSSQATADCGTWGNVLLLIQPWTGRSFWMGENREYEELRMTLFPPIVGDPWSICRAFCAHMLQGFQQFGNSTQKVSTTANQQMKIKRFEISFSDFTKKP